MATYANRVQKPLFLPWIAREADRRRGIADLWFSRKRRRIKTSLKTLSFWRSSDIGESITKLTGATLSDSLICAVSGLSIDSLLLIAPLVGLVCGGALHLSGREREVLDSGKWLLIASPTPFNRFVMLRCPSISFLDGEDLAELNEKLLKEERHFVRVKGSIPGEVRKIDGPRRTSKELSYQRYCVSTPDGGVVSLDWPWDLEMENERGMDTTVLIVPGTTEGSLNGSVREFVQESIRHGLFPIVMNPRGCAGSPVTTARLFTAADSDDVGTVVEFINRSRPWSTLVAVAWGYGANMVTKYLTEVGEKTPLTAVASINNPFDLEEATRPPLSLITPEQNLTEGFKGILQANKELFQGREKGFSVEEGLSATSIRDFDEAISMVSYGFGSLEEFYRKSSTREFVEKLKIPVLFIQTDEGATPLFSVPRSAIAENPYTSLLLCSCASSNLRTKEPACALSWCQNLILDWLSAVELAFLKGLHPLLKQADIPVSPSKSLVLSTGRSSGDKILMKKGNYGSRSLRHKGSAFDRQRNSVESHFLNQTLKDPSSFKREGNHTIHKPDVHLEAHTKSGKLTTEQRSKDDILLEAGFAHDNLVEKGHEEGDANSETGQILQTATVVMKMLDVTMPGTLGDEQKKKVLVAVGRGETLMKALQEAVPENVRGKITTAVSELAQTQGKNLNIKGLVNFGRVSGIVEWKSKVAGNLDESLQKYGESDAKQPHGSTSNHGDAEGKSSYTYDSQESKVRLKDDLVEFVADDRSSNLVGADDSVISSMTSNVLSSKKVTEYSTAKSESFSGSSIANPKSDTPANSLKNTDANLLEETRVYTSENGNKYRETLHKDIIPKGNEGKDNPQMSTKVLEKGNSHDTMTRTHCLEDDSMEEEFNIKSQSLTDDGETSMKNDTETGDSSRHMQESLDEKECLLKHTQDPQPSVLPLPPQDPPSITGVSQALDALKGFDDSTQMAVNSVFGVIENVIEQLEKDNHESNAEESLHKHENCVISTDCSSKNQKLEKENDGNVTGSANISQSHQKVKPLNSSGPDVSPPAESSNCWSTSFQVDKFKTAVAAASHSEEAGKNSSMHGLPDCETSCFKQSKSGSGSKSQLHIVKNPCGNPYTNVFHADSLLSLNSHGSLDLASTNDLLLEYFPDEGQWKLYNNIEDDDDDYLPDRKNISGTGHSFSEVPDVDIEKVIPDGGLEPSSSGHVRSSGSNICTVAGHLNIVRDDDIEELARAAESIVLNAINVEVSRRLGGKDGIEPRVHQEVEQLARGIYLAVKHSILQNPTRPLLRETNGSTKIGTLRGEDIINSISMSARNMSYLLKILPIGFVVGSSLASLGEVFHVDTGNYENERVNTGPKPVIDNNEECKHQMDCVSISQNQNDVNCSPNQSMCSSELDNVRIMIGAVTALLGVTSILAHRQNTQPLGRPGINVSSSQTSMVRNLEKKESKLDDGAQEGGRNDIVSTLAEKAYSIASPVVPLKDDGEVDHDRLVAILTDLGQRGGILRSVGKVALLWGGVRGAMSLTDRLISFLHIADRPLIHRLIGAACMVLVLWSPVVIPLLPTLLQRWSAHSSAGIVEYACIVGLYISLLILLMIWGKRIRGYESPFAQYGLGLQMHSRKELHDMLKGLIGGIMLVMSVHTISTLLGYASFGFPPNLLSSTSFVGSLKTFGGIIILSARGITTSIGLAVVEELIFRSWLPEEITVDLGYNWAIIISSISFAIFQGSLELMPGHWFLSLALIGIKERANGSLWVPIGVRSGLSMCTFIIETGGFLRQHQLAPFSIAGANPCHPFSGAIGLGFIVVMAILFHPLWLFPSKKIS